MKLLKEIQLFSIFSIYFAAHPSYAGTLGNVTSPTQTPSNFIQTELEPSQNSYDKKYSTTLGIQFPSGLALEGSYRLNKRFSFAAEIGGFIDPGFVSTIIKDQLVGNLSGNKSDYKVDIKSYTFEMKGRWHPAEGSFFLGLATGYQAYFASLSRMSTRETTGTIKISSFHFTPHLGWHWIQKSGLTLGTEVGALIPLGGRSLELGEFTSKYHKEVNDAIQPYIGYVLPYVTFIKAGYSF